LDHFLGGLPKPLGLHLGAMLGSQGAVLGALVAQKCCKKQYEMHVFNVACFPYFNYLGTLLEAILARLELFCRPVKSGPKSDPNFDKFFDGFWSRFGVHFGSTLELESN